MTRPSAPPAAETVDADAAALEITDVVTAIFRMLDDNIGAVVSAGNLASSRVEFGGGADAFATAPHAPVSLVGVADALPGTHGPAHG